MKTFACTFLASAFAALVLTPLVARIARRLGLVDVLGPRKVHSCPVPRIGGVAILLSMLIPTILVTALDNTVGSALREIQTKVIVMLGAATFVLLMGLVDDVRGLRARTKLLLQVMAAAAVCGFGVRIEGFAVGDLFTLSFGWLAWPITILWIVGITNAINLIDGLDGLAAGISAVACGVIAVFAISTGQPVMAVLMLALLGSLIGFLYFNFNPAKIFMGDCGSMLVGFVLATSSVMCASKSAALVGLALPALALGVPIFDTLFSMVRRILERRSVFSPDRGHFHHRLLKMGLRQRHVVLIMYGVTALVAGLGMFMMATRDAGTVAVFVSVAVLLLLLFRVAGSVHLRDSLAALRQNMALAREARDQKQTFEAAILRTGEARSFDEWWQALCAAAGQLEFASLALSVEGSDGGKGGARGDGGTSVCETLIWRNSALTPALGQIIHVTMPPRLLAPGLHGRLELDVWVNGSLESAARSATLFSRLLDEYGLADPTRLPGALEGRPHGLRLAEPSARGALHDRPPRGPMLWDAV
jgi:UDP-GlcNAc:undecaprenyl-phosphate GlcNAc-1-phosphate transferase